MQRKNSQSIGEILRQFLRVTQLEQHVLEGRIATVWQETLGEQITRETERIHLLDGNLTVVLRSPSLKQEILMQRTAIRQALNEKLGAEIIKNVFVR